MVNGAGVSFSVGCDMSVLAKNEDLAEPRLTSATLPVFYRKVMALRFPIDVVDVIDIRDAINSAADAFTLPAPTTAHRQLRESVRSVIEATNIDQKHHIDRLIHIMTMFRELHRSHRIASRTAEAKLRQRQLNNREARRLSIHYGFCMLIAALFPFVAWLIMKQPHWIIPSSAVFLAYLSCDYFYSLTALKREHQLLAREIEDLLMERIGSWRRKAFTYRIALILGYKRSADVNVFLTSPDEVNMDRRWSNDGVIRPSVQ